MLQPMPVTELLSVKQTLCWNDSDRTVVCWIDLVLQPMPVTILISVKQPIFSNLCQCDHNFWPFEASCDFLSARGTLCFLPFPRHGGSWAGSVLRPVSVYGCCCSQLSLTCLPHSHRYSRLIKKILAGTHKTNKFFYGQKLRNKWIGLGDEDIRTLVVRALKEPFTFFVCLPFLLSITRVSLTKNWIL